jgi:hypothetical protein
MYAFSTADGVVRDMLLPVDEFDYDEETIPACAVYLLVMLTVSLFRRFRNNGFGIFFD